ncbi:MAG: hypothetical protein KAH57_01185 [Thermoplasmata archaeon]|nr:hypothetical protein [Thermoplasmata archaeon]
MSVNRLLILSVALFILLPLGASDGEDEGSYLESLDPAGDVWLDVNRTDEISSRDVDITRVSCNSSEVPFILEMSVVGRIRLEERTSLYNYTFKLIKENGERDNVFITSDVDWENYPYPIISSVSGEGTSRLRVEYDPRLIEVETGEEYVVTGIMGEASISDDEGDMAYDLINGTTPTDEVEIGVLSSSWRYEETSTGLELEAKVVGTSSGGANIWIGWSADFNDGYFSGIQWYRSLFNDDGSKCLRAHLLDTSEDGDLTSFEYWVLCTDDSSDHCTFKELIEDHGGLRTVYVQVLIFPSDDITTYSGKKVNVEFQSSYVVPDDGDQKEDEDGFPWVFPAFVSALVIAGLIVWWRDRREEMEDR